MDDEVLGCGGVIARHKAQKDEVNVIFIAHRIYNHRFDKKKSDTEEAGALKAKFVLGYDKAVFMALDDERLDACLQDIIVPLEKYVEELRPQIAYIPFRGDNNQDHRAVFDAARVVLRPLASPFIKTICMYEVSSSTEQSPPLQESAFLPNYYVDIEGHINKKIKALSCYATEKRDYPHPRSKKAVKILAQKRGLETGFKFAEAFMIIRSKWE